ncbi:hypothetical protein, partial [Otoolea muris]|uniref:hypothetical protein n=1 Tax=Otoolea muris TaxID=2941515 RepID=UPI00203D6989
DFIRNIRKYGIFLRTPHFTSLPIISNGLPVWRAISSLRSTAEKSGKYSSEFLQTIAEAASHY